MNTGETKKKLVINKISITRLDREIISRAKGGVINDTEDNCPATEKTKVTPVCITIT
jgi:hypothetical protein